MPELSVIIPTFARPEKLARCLAALAAQSLPHETYEVLIGIDGPDAASPAAARRAWADAPPATLTIVEGPRQGLNATRNALLPLARGRFLVSMNDDVYAEPHFLKTHLDAQLEAQQGAAPGAVIVGHSPFANFDSPTLFDRLCAETSMIFFYDQMLGPGARPPSHDWGFRHCYGLNFSAPLAPVRDSGGFIALPLGYGYDDIELAWRLKTRHNFPTLFRPHARAVHDHRYTPREVLEREEKLGRSAWHFARAEPEFARATFSRDITSREELDYARAFVERENALAERLEAQFLRLDAIPAGAIAASEAGARTIITLLYQQHLALKRWRWRRGLLDAATGA